MRNNRKKKKTLEMFGHKGQCFLTVRLVRFSVYKILASCSMLGFTQ